jgi:hypothetical protein
MVSAKARISDDPRSRGTGVMESEQWRARDEEECLGRINKELSG